MNKQLMKEVTIEDATRVYLELGICSHVHNGQIICEIECEDYCEE